MAYMDLESILSEYDSMFGKNSLKEIENYLVVKIDQAQAEGESGILVTLLNEIIGFYRDTTQREKALLRCEQLQVVLKEMRLEGRIDYATSLLNVANAYRAFGLFEESLKLYHVVEDTYKGQVAPADFMYASLYNNWSLLYQEMEDYEAARDMLEEALTIVECYEDAVIEQATTKTNLAATLLQIGTKEAQSEAIVYLKEALRVFEKDGGRDFHYGAALVAMGDAYSCRKKYEKAASYYEKGLIEIEKHVGRTDNYNRVMEKYEYARKQPVGDKKKTKEATFVRNLEKCRGFYEKYGKEMLHERFPEYEERIAVGLVGEGSDCFGFDDRISMDHDYGIGFCVWLTEEDYKEIGESLQEEYETLIRKHASEASNGSFLQGRRGVFSINAFYNNLLGTDFDYVCFVKEKQDNAKKVGFGGETLFTDCFRGDSDEYRLATAVNGEVFVDKQGAFSNIRKELAAYYPKEIWKRKIAQRLHDFSQYAQSNYPRMMAREDYVTARLCVAKALESAMDLVYLLQREYAPYYKWKKKGLERMALCRNKLPLAKEILELVEVAAGRELPMKAWENTQYDSSVINEKDALCILFEKMASAILQEMKKQRLVNGTDTFLENYIAQLLRDENMDIVEKIVKLEWEQFDKVQNEGGRAGCQDDYTTFSIIRKSQYLTWPEELLQSFYNDLIAAQQRGWNLIMEKYARMMKSTAPERYIELEKELPALSEERIAIQEEIIKIQVLWMEEFARAYPKMAGNARVIHTDEDTEFNTSYETYLRGELGTYSESTLILYGRFITGLLKENRNLAYEIMEQTAGLYGYDSLKKAEENLL